MSQERSIARSAASLARSHPHAPPRDILDLVFQGAEGSDLDFRSPTALGGSLAWPTSPLGQIIAAAFDRDMDPGDWHLIDHGPQAMRDALGAVWQDEVLRKATTALKLPSLRG